jgi:glyoxylase-like metal-dependent hydrolase (beta-lactamase superfamily II)
MFWRIGQIIDPEKIDTVVVNHAEMDHSGSLGRLIDRVHPERVLASPACETALKAHFHYRDWPLTVVKSKDRFNMGRRNVTFLETKMLHWPDSMFSFIEEDGILISSDAFGEHYATSERFDDEVDTGELMRQAGKYYANILNPYSPLVLKLLEEVGKLGLKIEMIAPDHGVVWRKDPGRILSAYAGWGAQKTRDKALVVFDTMWHSTEKMAEAYARDYGLDIRVARFHNIYGPEGTYAGGREKAPAALCRKVAEAPEGGTLEIWGDGKQTRSYCYIDDCVEGILQLMASGCASPVNIGSDRLVSVDELADIIVGISGKSLARKYLPTAPQGVRGRNADLAMARRELGWEPRVALEAGLEKTYRWIRERVEEEAP